MAAMGDFLSRVVRQAISVTSRGIRALTFSSTSRELHTSAVDGAGRGVLVEGEDPKSVSDAQWKERLTSEQYYICRHRGTEAPFTGDLLNIKKAGVYSCTCCGADLFSSKAKFESGSGWPSFYEAVTSDNNETNVLDETDSSHGMVRTEVLCRQCHSHLGHVFNDGPLPTRQRYCINSVTLQFQEKNSNKQD